MIWLFWLLTGEEVEIATSVGSKALSEMAPVVISEWPNKKWNNIPINILYYITNDR